MCQQQTSGRGPATARHVAVGGGGNGDGPGLSRAFRFYRMLNLTPGLRPSVNHTSSFENLTKAVMVLERIFSPRSKRTIV